MNKQQAIAAAQKKEWPGLEKFVPHEVGWIAKFSKDANEWNVKPYPYFGARLRLLHEDAENHSEPAPIEMITEETMLSDNVVIIRATVKTWRGTFTGSKMGDCSDYEKMETMALGRALRFAGYGVEFTGAEEMQSWTDKQENGESEEEPEAKPEKPADDKPKAKGKPKPAKREQTALEIKARAALTGLGIPDAKVYFDVESTKHFTQEQWGSVADKCELYRKAAIGLADMLNESVDDIMGFALQYEGKWQKLNSEILKALEDEDGELANDLWKQITAWKTTQAQPELEV